MSYDVLCWRCVVLCQVKQRFSFKAAALECQAIRPNIDTRYKRRQEDTWLLAISVKCHKPKFLKYIAWVG